MTTSIGGTAPDSLKCDVKEAVEKATAGTHLTVRIARPDEAFGGDDPDNIVNRLSSGHGIQIEQSFPARSGFGLDVAAAVADLALPMVGSG